MKTYYKKYQRGAVTIFVTGLAVMTLGLITTLTNYNFDVGQKKVLTSELAYMLARPLLTHQLYVRGNKQYDDSNVSSKRLLKAILPSIASMTDDLGSKPEVKFIFGRATPKSDGGTPSFIPLSKEDGATNPADPIPIKIDKDGNITAKENADGFNAIYVAVIANTKFGSEQVSGEAILMANVPPFEECRRIDGTPCQNADYTNCCNNTLGFFQFFYNSATAMTSMMSNMCGAMGGMMDFFSGGLFNLQNASSQMCNAAEAGMNSAMCMGGVSMMGMMRLMKDVITVDGDSFYSDFTGTLRCFASQGVKMMFTPVVMMGVGVQWGFDTASDIVKVIL